MASAKDPRQMHQVHGRDALFQQLMDGTINPTLAEAEAARLDLGPLQRSPDPDEHDPMQKTRWTMSMTLAWIIGRNATHVRDWDNDYRAECYDFHAREYRLPSTNGELRVGWYLEQRYPLSAVTAELEASDLLTDDGTQPTVSTFSEAKNILWCALANHEIVAEAIDVASGSPCEIRTIEWPHLEVYETESSREYLAYSDDVLNKPRYRNVLFRPNEVQHRWKPISTVAKTVSTVGTEKKCKNWLVSEMLTSPDRKRMTKEEAFARAREQFAGISRRAFDRSWDRAIHDTSAFSWSRSGAPKRPRNSSHLKSTR